MTTSFGLLNGQQITKLSLQNEHLQVDLLDYGATIQALRVRSRTGEWVDVCLGYDTPEEYAAGDGYLGAVVGRYANRIAGAAFTLNGERFLLTPNEGENQLHGGPGGFHQRIWDYTCGENFVTFSLFSAHGEEGYPGNLRVWTTYRLEGTMLLLDYRGVSDRDTVLNVTNHVYLNLGGHGSGPVYGHTLTVNADSYTPVDGALIPTGELAPVEGTLLDLRQEVLLRDRLTHPELASTAGYDHNFILSGGKEPAARLSCPATGIALALFTTKQGLQLYTAGALTARAGKNGVQYGRHHGVCLETQFFPDSPNRPAFPSPVLRAGEEYRHTTAFRFSVLPED